MSVTNITKDQFRPGPNNCPVLEQTADGRSAGRCWFHCPNDVCPRHGDVAEPLRVYRESGRLTRESEL